MSDAERLAAIRAALGVDDGSDAWGNLLGAVIDMEHDAWVADELCQRTLNRVVGQLKQVTDILRNSN